MLKLFEKLFASSTTSETGIAQSEREAIVDLLLLAIYADNHISLDENQVLEDGLSDLGWDSGTSVSMYVNTANTKARNALSDETSHAEFMDSVTTRLNSATSKEKALGLLTELFEADGTSVAEEDFYKTLETKLA